MSATYQSRLLLCAIARLPARDATHRYSSSRRMAGSHDTKFEVHRSPKPMSLLSERGVDLLAVPEDPVPGCCRNKKDCTSLVPTPRHSPRHREVPRRSVAFDPPG